MVRPQSVNGVKLLCGELLIRVDDRLRGPLLRAFNPSVVVGGLLAPERHMVWIPQGLLFILKIVKIQCWHQQWLINFLVFIVHCILLLIKLQMTSTASSTLKESINFDGDYEDKVIDDDKRMAVVDFSVSDSSTMDTRDKDVFCCVNRKLSTVFLLIFGLGAFVGFIDYFIVKDSLLRKSLGVTTYKRSKLQTGLGLDTTFENFLAHYGKSYVNEQDYNKRKELFEQSKREIRRIQELDGPNATYTMELNEFADYSEQEFKLFWTGAKPLNETVDTHSVFYDFEEEKEIDNYYIEKYLEEMESNPHFMDGEEHGTLDQKISEIVPDNHYGDIGDEVNRNEFEQIGEMSYEEAIRDIEDMEFERSLNKDGAYNELDGYVKVNSKKRALSPRVGVWPFEPIKPLELDWRQSQVVSRVKKQGRCGACWAIAVAGALESANAIQNQKLVEVSEQQILDCASMEPYKSVQCDGGYISEALRYSKTTLLATRDNYPYLGFNNTCRKVSERDLMLFKDLPKVDRENKIDSVVDFWTNYYHEKFQNEMAEVKPQSSENKVSSTDAIYEKYYRDMNFASMQMDEYTIPMSSQLTNIDSNHQWKIQNFIDEHLPMMLSTDDLEMLNPVTNKAYKALKNENDVVQVKASHFYRLWASSPRKLKKALKNGPVTVMVNSQTPFKFYKEGIIDTKACEPEVDHAVLAVGYGTYTNEQGKTDDYFILKNSWGRQWGEQGYARITANRKKFGKGMCGIYIESYIPFVETNESTLNKFKQMLDE